MAENTAELQIVLTAKDVASAAFATVGGEAKALAGSLQGAGTKGELAATGIGHAGGAAHEAGEKAAAEKEHLGYFGTQLEDIGKLAAGMAATFGVIELGKSFVEAVRGAGEFQESMTALVTGAGEAKGAIDEVSQGVLNMAGEVGAAPKDLAAGLYLIESAGFHGAAGLDVLKAAAEGAKVGMADQADVANAVTSALNAYGLQGKDAAGVTGQLIATVAAGKMHMQDLAGALGSVLPAASTAHIGLNEVGGAIATMTAMGTPAADAATYLRQTILSLENPSSKAQKALKEIGLSAAQVSDSLTKQGLVSTLTLIQDHLSTQFPEGGAAATAALAAIAGGAKQMQGVLELTGSHLATFAANVKSIGTTSEGAAKLQEGWADLQGDFNVQLAKLKDSLSAVSIEIGGKLLPALTAAMGWLTGGGLDGVAKFAGTVGTNLTPALATLGGQLATFAATALPAVKGAMADLAPAGQAMQQIFQQLRALFGQLAGAVQAIIAPFAGAAGGMSAGQAAGEAFGTALEAVVRAVDELSSGIMAATKFVSDHKGVQLVLVTVLGAATAAWALSTAAAIAHTVATTAATAATNAMAVAQGLLNAVMDANPIGILVIALAGLVAGAIYAYNNFTTFRNVVNTAFTDVRGFFDTLGTKANEVFTGIRGFIDSLNAKFGSILPIVGAIILGPVGLVGGFIVAYKTSEQFRDRVNAALGEVGAAFSALGTKLGAFVGTMEHIGTDLVQGLINGISDMTGAVEQEVRNVINLIPDGAKKLLGISSPSKVFHEIGQNAMAGLANGITAGSSAATAAAAKAAKATAAAATTSLNPLKDAIAATSAQLTAVRDGFREATAALKSQYTPQIDALTQRLHDQQAAMGETTREIQDEQTAYNAAAAAAAAHGTVTKEITAQLKGEYLPGLDTLKAKLNDQRATVAATQAELTKLNDAYRAGKDQLAAQTTPTIDALTSKLADQRRTLQLLQEQIRNGQIPAVNDLTNLITTQTSPAVAALTTSVTAATTPTVTQTTSTLGLRDAALAAATGLAAFKQDIAELPAIIAGALPSIKQFIDALNAIPRDITVSIHQVISSVGTAFSATAGAVGHNATGTSNWRGGLSWVGENGPELVNLPPGSQVIPNHRLGDVGGGRQISVNVTVTGNTILSNDSQTARQLARILQPELNRLVTLNA